MNNDKLKRDIEKEYFRKTKKSKVHFENGKKYIPGGTTRQISHFEPYPFFFKEGKGCRVFDVDGNEYLDFVNNYSAAIHGHAHPLIKKAIDSHSHIINGSLPGVEQHNLAHIICDRIPAMEMIRFCNSGSEATMFAMRTARYFTGRNQFLKIDGGFHGTHDYAYINCLPDMEADGDPNVVSMLGISPTIEKDFFVTPFNDLERMENILKDNSKNIAAIIIEPCPGVGGFILPHEGYLKGVRELADKYDVLLIFDEVITFRFHEGGMQTMVDVKPDITALGKLIGGGLPIGAFGGSRDIMDVFDNTKRVMGVDLLNHSGTFSGNAITMAAGLAAMEAYGQKEIDRLNNMGDRLRNGIISVMDTVGIDGQVTGLGSVMEMVFSGTDLNNCKDVMLAAVATNDLCKYLHLDLCNHGVFYTPRGMISLSTPMTESEIDKAVDVIGDSIEKVKPLISP